MTTFSIPLSLGAGSMALLSVTVNVLTFTATPAALNLSALGQKAHVRLVDQLGNSPSPSVFKLANSNPAVASAVFATDGVDVTAVGQGSCNIDLVTI